MHVGFRHALHKPSVDEVGDRGGHLVQSHPGVHFYGVLGDRGGLPHLNGSALGHWLLLLLDDVLGLGHFLAQRTGSLHFQEELVLLHLAIAIFDNFKGLVALLRHVDAEDIAVATLNENTVLCFLADPELVIRHIELGGDSITNYGHGWTVVELRYFYNWWSVDFFSEGRNFMGQL